MTVEEEIKVSILIKKAFIVYLAVAKGSFIIRKRRQLSKTI